LTLFEPEAGAEPASEPATPRFSWVSVVVSAVFLIGIPGLFGWFLLDHLDVAERHERRRHEEQELLEILAQVAQRGNMVRRFGNVFDRLAMQSWSLPALAGRLAKLARQNPDVLDVYLFDASGKRHPLQGQPDRLVFASQQFFKTLVQPGETVSEKLVRAFAGNGGAAAALRNSPGTLTDLLNGGRMTWGGWYAMKDRREAVVGHLLAFVHREAIPADRLLNIAVAETNRMIRGVYVIGWQDPLAPGRLQPATHVFPAGLAEHLAALPTGENLSQWKGRTLATFMTEEGERLFGCSVHPLSLSEASATRRGWFSVALVIAFFILVRSLSGVQHLRTKVIWLFAIAGGFPLAVFLSTILIDRQDREEVLERRIREKHLEYLTRFDVGARSEFLPALRSYHRFFEETRAFPLVATGTDIPGIDAPVDRLRAEIQAQQGLISRCTLVTRDGRVAFFHGYDPDRSEGIRRVEEREALPHVALNLLEIVNQSPPSSATRALANPLMSLVVSTKFSPDWLEEDGLLKENQVGQGQMLSYFKLYSDERHAHRAVFFATHDSRTAQIRYLQRYLGRRTAWKDRAVRFYAVPVTPGGRWPSFIEPRLARDPMIRKLRDLVLTSGIPQHQTVWLNDRQFLVTALRGNSLSGYVLMLARPISAIQAQTRSISSQGAMLAGAMLLLVMGIAWATARGLLAPLQELAGGLAALKERDFTHQVRPGHLEELAAVARRFNAITAGLKDLELARSVQETLWPAKGLAGEEWRVRGRCVTASELGGDFYDWFSLPDGRLVIAVGDVAGHGIPSALVAASAKMELALNAEMEDDPAQVLVAMNAGLLTQAGRKRPMSFWLGIFDPNTRLLRFANAGQSFPVLLADEQEPAMVKSTGYPLGSRRKAAFSGSTLDLTAGGRLLVYSDGIVEAHAPDQEPYDYSRLTALAHSLFRERVDAEASIEAIFRAVTAWSRRSVPEDDQTLVILDVDPVRQAELRPPSEPPIGEPGNPGGSRNPEGERP